MYNTCFVQSITHSFVISYTHIFSQWAISFYEVHTQFSIRANTHMKIWTIITSTHPTKEERTNRHLLAIEKQQLSIIRILILGSYFLL